MDTTLASLFQKKEDWLDMEGIDDEEGEQEWIKEGIGIYEKLINVDKENRSFYYQELSRLYLNYGQNEKLKLGNFQRAVRNLKQASRIDSQNPRPCYHLSFLYAKEQNYEGALFYAERSINLGIDQKRKNKLYCNMALCYFELGFKEEADRFLIDVLEIAQADSVLFSFVKPYEAKIKARKNQDYIPLSEHYGTIVETDEEVAESALSGERVILTIQPYTSYLNGENDSVSLSAIKAQILEQILLSKEPVSVSQLEAALKEDEASKMSESYIPRMINGIRKDIKQAAGMSGTELLKTENGKYSWNHSLRRGSIYYKHYSNRGARRREGITIL